MAEPLMTIKDLCAYLQIGRTTVYEWVEQGELPAPLTFGASRVKRWRKSDVDAMGAGIEDAPEDEAGADATE